MKTWLTIALTVMGVFGVWSAAQGAVLVNYTDSPAVAQDSDGGSQTVSITDFSTTTNDLLVVSFGQEHDNGSGSGINNVKYGGAAMTVAVSEDLEHSDGDNTNTAHSSIYYIDPANGTGDITFDTGGTAFTRYMVNAILLSGENGPVAFDASATNNLQESGGNSSLTAGPVSVDSGDFVIDSLTEADGKKTFTTKGLVDSGGTLLNEFGSGEHSAFGASYWGSDSAQDISTTWAWDDEGSDYNLSALTMASFTEIPEPGSFIFLVLGGVALLKRRPRRA
ncbi:MAG: hypothetical protein ACOCWJ_03440 [Verrucomicrobiota bacterium]